MNTPSLSGANGVFNFSSETWTLPFLCRNGNIDAAYASMAFVSRSLEGEGPRYTTDEQSSLDEHRLSDVVMHCPHLNGKLRFGSTPNPSLAQVPLLRIFFHNVFSPPFSRYLRPSGLAV